MPVKEEKEAHQKQIEEPYLPPQQTPVDKQYQKQDIESVLNDEVKTRAIDAKSLQTLQYQLRIENEFYLSQHPEIQDILNYLMRTLLEEQPQTEDLIHQFISQKMNAEDLEEQVLLHRKQSASTKQLLKKLQEAEVETRFS